MLRDAFYIPSQIGDVALFGPSGLLVWLWLAGCALWLGLAFRRGKQAGQEALAQLPMLLIVAAMMVWVMPRMFDLQGRLAVRGFGMAVLAGIVAGGWLAVYQAKRMGVDPEVIFSLGIWLFVAGFLGARTFYVIQKWPDFQAPTRMEQLWKILNFTQGGIVVYGSLIGALVPLLIFPGRYKLPALALCDLVSPAFALGAALGRLGCLANGCCFGGECELPWAMEFPVGSPPFIRQVEEGKIPEQTALLGLKLGGHFAPPVVLDVAKGSYAERIGLKAGMRITQVARLPMNAAGDVLAVLFSLRPGDQVSIQVADIEKPFLWSIPADAPRSRPVHPTQLYSSINAFLICLVLLAYYPYRRRDGEVIGILLTIYPVVRFLEEALRTDERAIGFTSMSISQNVSVLLLFAMAGYWFALLRLPAHRALPTADGCLTFPKANETSTGK